MQVWAHTLVKNEEKYLWYSVMSVICHVDRVLLWDSGSTDGSLEIERELKKKYPDKINLKQIRIGSPEDFPLVRQEMLEETKSDWFIVLDGDEVWWEDSIKKLVKIINEKGENLESIAVPMVYPVGDIFHRQEESAGRYELAGKKGHISPRAINRRIPGLSSSNPHGTWGWTDGDGYMIQNRDPKKILFCDAPYMHFSLLPRAGNRTGDLKVMKRSKKLKFELSKSFPKDFYYPEVFFKTRPNDIPSPWQVMPWEFKFRAFFETPVRLIKRKIWHGRVGY